MVDIIAPQGSITLIDDPKAFDVVPFKRKTYERIAQEFSALAR